MLDFLECSSHRSSSSSGTTTTATISLQSTARGEDATVAPIAMRTAEIDDMIMEAATEESLKEDRDYKEALENLGKRAKELQRVVSGTIREMVTVSFWLSTLNCITQIYN